MISRDPAFHLSVAAISWGNCLHVGVDRAGIDIVQSGKAAVSTARTTTVFNMFFISLFAEPFSKPLQIFLVFMNSCVASGGIVAKPGGKEKPYIFERRSPRGLAGCQVAAPSFGEKGLERRAKGIGELQKNYWIMRNAES